MRLTHLADLVAHPAPAATAPPGTYTDLACLEDTHVLDVLFDIARSRLGILLEGRQSGSMPAGNVAVVVAEAVTEFRWDCRAHVGPVQAIRVVAGGLRPRRDGVGLTMVCETDSDLFVAAGRMAVHFVAVPDLPQAPVDYASPDDEIRVGTPSWQHPGEAVTSWWVLP